MKRRTSALFSSDIQTPRLWFSLRTLTPYWTAVSTIGETEAWTALLETERGDQRLVHEDFYGARSARPVSIPAELGPAAREALDQVGIETLYEHQQQALMSAFEGP